MNKKLIKLKKNSKKRVHIFLYVIFSFLLVFCGSFVFLSNNNFLDRQGYIGQKIAKASSADPEIFSIAGTVSNGKTITIGGQNFGSGPNILIFDDFEKGTIGQPIRTGEDSATVGGWTSLGDNKPYYQSTYVNSGHYAFQEAVGSTCTINGSIRARVKFPSAANEFFGIWWVYLPQEDAWPGEGSESTQGGPNWKQVWVHSGLNGASCRDVDAVLPVCLPRSGSQSSGCALSGNCSGGYTQYGNNMNKGEWKRFLIHWIGSNNGQGKVYSTYLQRDGQNTQIIHRDDTNITNQGNSDFSTYNLVDLGAYSHVTIGSCSHPTFDDFYFTIGPNAQARIEIGDNPEYSNCTNLAVITPTSWSENSITATVRSGSITDGSNVYLFVIDSNGSISNGYPATLGSSQIDTTAPVITQVTAVSTPTTDTTPDYTFYSNEAGDITYIGDCSSTATNAVAGRNLVVFTALSAGAHSNCAIRVSDAAGNSSNTLFVPSFTIENSVVACTSFVYSSWSACQVNNTRTRTIVSSLPANCTGGSPEPITEICVYSTGSSGDSGSSSKVSDNLFCTSFNYSDWSACQVNNTRTRTIVSSLPANCTGGSPEPITQGCVYAAGALATTTAAALVSDATTNLKNQPSVIVNSVTQTEAKLISTYNQKVALTQTAINLYNKIVSSINDGTILTNQERYSIAYFIQHGTPTTFELGCGERTGVISSYQSTYDKLPKTEAEWQDVIKIANGRWVDEKNARSETIATSLFIKVYQRKPNLANTYDSNAIQIIAYGLRPLQRNINSEKSGIRIFKAIFGADPVTAQSWDVVRAIAYSGARR